MSTIQSDKCQCLFRCWPNDNDDYDYDYYDEKEERIKMITRTRRRTKTKTRRRRENNLVKYSICCLLIIILTIIEPIELAVVRPTIFSDMPQTSQESNAAISTPTNSNSLQTEQSSSSSSLGSNLKQATEQQQQQQQESKLQSSPVLSDGPNTNNNNQNNQSNWPMANALSGVHQQQQQQQQQQQNTRIISPLKSRFCTNSNGLRLDGPIGIHSFSIDDLSFSASSFSNEQAGPQMARLNRDIAGGAWCPVKPISSSNFGKEWIQVKLNRSIVVTAIETQGRFGLGSGKEFAPNYQVEYSRNGGLTWFKWRDILGKSLLRGNDDVNSVVRNELSPPIVGANAIRILPYSSHLRTVCLRFELHGCQYDEGAPIAYSSPDGINEARWGHLIDHTYDGLRQQGQLAGGLGQLVDGVKGADNFSHNNGFEWVGWKSMNGDVVIEFAFKTLRNFTGALFHSNNLFSSGVEVFQGVDVHYGIDIQSSLDPLNDALVEQRRRDALFRTGRQTPTSAELLNAQIQIDQLNHRNRNHNQQTLWSSDLLSIEYEPDKKVESARPVTVHLKQRLANRLRFVLKFASKWILVSEVEFLSHPVELLSLQSISEQHTPSIVEALTPARSYDEYVAILREHQLRRIATNALFEAVTIGAVNPVIPTQISSVLNGYDQAGDEPASVENQQQQQQQTSLDQSQGLNFMPNSVDQAKSQSVAPSSSAYSDYFGPSIINKRISWPIQGNNQQQLIQASDSSLQQQQPATNPILSGPFPTIYSPPPFTIGGSANEILNTNNVNGALSTSSSGSKVMAASSTGLTTVILLACVLIIVILVALFMATRYRLHRQQPKLGFPSVSFGGSSTGTSHHSDTPIKGLVSPFMSVFSSNNNQQPLTLDNTPQHSIYNNSSTFDYNTIFAPRNMTNLATTNQLTRNTLGKHLGTLSGGKQSNNLFAMKQQQQQQLANQPGQLLVSVRDNQNNNSSSSQIFGGHSKAPGQQSVSTQLIVGLNRANPMAQQQIYNNNNNSLSMSNNLGAVNPNGNINSNFANCTNRTYATIYTGSMSMASSSTTANQGDYNECEGWRE